MVRKVKHPFHVELLASLEAMPTEKVAVEILHEVKNHCVTNFDADNLKLVEELVKGYSQGHIPKRLR